MIPNRDLFFLYRVFHALDLKSVIVGTKFFHLIIMRTYCAVRTCNNLGKHVMPRNPLLRTQWIKALRLDEVKSTKRQLNKYLFLCSAHFKPTDLIISPEFKGNKRTIRLRRKAVPSIFPWTPEAELNLAGPEEEDIDIPIRSTELPRKTYGAPVVPFTFVEEIPLTLPEPSTEENPLELVKEEFITDDYYGDTEAHLELREGAEQSSDDEPTKPHAQLENDNNKKLSEVTVKTCDNNYAYEVPIIGTQVYKKSEKVGYFFTKLDNSEKVKLVYNSNGECKTKVKYLYALPKNFVPYKKFS